MAKKNEKKANNDEQEEAIDEINTEGTENPVNDEPCSDKKDEEIAKLKDQMLRQLAEYDNYRKRTAKERMETETNTISKVVNEFLPVLDNLERAISHDCTDEGYKKGVEIIYESFLETLKNLGVETIRTEKEEFNPNFHQAVQQVEASEHESGTITETFQKGYKIGDKILRFAMVAVAK